MTEATPATQTVPAKAASSTDKFDIMAIIGFVLSIFNLCSWFIPLCGCPMALIGIILSAFGMKSSKYRVFAIIGLVISILAFIVTMINAAIGAYTGYTNPELYNVRY